MKIRPYVEKLEQSEEYKNFKVKYPDAFLVAGFFILDLETNQNIHQIDFYVPSEKKIAAFTLDGEVTLQLMDMMSKDGKSPEKLDLETNIDLDALSGILTDEMHNRGISEDIRKIIAIVQNIDGKKIWNLNCVLTGMEILKSHVDDASQSVLKLERSSVMDLMKKLPGKSVAKPPETQSGKGGMEDEMKKLDKLSEEINKEKERLKEEMRKEKPEEQKKE